MINRHNEQDNRQTPVTGRDRRGEAPVYTAARSRARRRNPLIRLIPVLIVGGFALLIAHQEVPAFADWWARTFTPGAWQTKDTCRQAALADLKDGQYARLLRSGELHETPDGPYVTRMTFTLLDAGGNEQRVEYSCYLDSQGQLFRLNRKSE